MCCFPSADDMASGIWYDSLRMTWKADPEKEARERMKRTTATGLILLTLCSIISMAGAATPDISTLYKNRDVDAAWDPKGTITITLSETGAEVSDGAAVSVEGKTVTILEEGDYLLTGTWEGQVAVNVSEEEKVRLILQNVTIDSPTGPAILEKSADKLVLTLDSGSVNTLSDHTEQTVGDDTAAAAVYAQDDLSINGEGKLVIEGRVKNGIHSKADLVIASGSFDITSENDGIKGRNSVLILGGTLTVSSRGDGIVSNRNNREDKGWVIVAGGSIAVRTGDGAEIGRRKDASSRKGIKAETDLTIVDGTIVLDTEDDGLHAVNVTITGGSMDISTGDDAVKADEELRITGGDVLIRLCKDETKGEVVEIAEGTVRTEE